MYQLTMHTLLNMYAVLAMVDGSVTELVQLETLPLQRQLVR